MAFEYQNMKLKEDSGTTNEMSYFQVNLPEFFRVSEQPEVTTSIHGIHFADKNQKPVLSGAEEIHGSFQASSEKKCEKMNQQDETCDQSV